jgi:type IV fimbrial biogenesis protein FimT
MIVVAAILAILTTIAVPAVSGWLPDYRLKSAARNLYSDMQRTKLGAIKHNSDWAVVFDPGNGRYLICSDRGADGTWSTTGDNSVEKEVAFADYGGGAGYGHGGATDNATSGGGAFPGDEVSYGSNVAVFNSRGTGSAGYVYLANSDGTAYAAGTRSSGVVLLRKWNGSGWN